MMHHEYGKPSRKLTFDEAVEVHLLLMDGWIQSRIAAKFDTNIGRISEINTGKLHPGSHETALRQRGKAA